MEGKQLLQDNSRFAGRLVACKLSTRHDGEREVYLTLPLPGAKVEGGDTIGEDLVLTVYNLGSKRYGGDDISRKRVPDFIKEVEFLRSRSSDRYFAPVVGWGIGRAGRHRLGWMLQRKVNGHTLSEEIRAHAGHRIPDFAMVMESLCAAVSEIDAYTCGGGHYNITPDNILLKIGDGKPVGACLIGLSDMGGSCHGTTHFSHAKCTNRLRAPETELGVFNRLTDIYALGIITTMMLAGDTGEAEDPTESAVSLSLQDFRSAFMKRAGPSLSSGQRIVLGKATSVKPSSRFMSADLLRSFLAKVTRDTAVSPCPETEKDTAPVSARGLDEVAGMAELKALFRRDFIRILQNSRMAQAYGIKPDNCTLLYGPQGCGKTFIAEKAAQESGLAYRVVNPSDLGSIYIHGAQQKIAELFDEAEKKAPMILIFNEFDSLVPKRDSDRISNQANEVNEMLAQLDNCASRGIYVIATTNLPGLIDPAIMRKGRVDRTVFVSLPDKEARKQLFKLEVEKRPFSEVDYEKLAAETENFTCSDISYIVEETARLCFEETLDRSLDECLPLSTESLMKVAKVTLPSVNEQQRREYLQLKEEMERNRLAPERKRVGFSL